MRISAAARSVGLVVAAIGVPLAGAGVIRLSRKACRAAEARKRHIVDLIRRNSGKDLSKVRRVIVVPGGGPGAPDDHGVPPWTRQRIKAAAEAYADSTRVKGEDALVVCTSAGSMNAAQPRDADDGHILFESTLMARVLMENGVPEEDIVCDFIPWDTVGNAWSVRLTLLAIFGTLYDHHHRPSHPRWLPRLRLSRCQTPEPNMPVDVYISDFHAERMAAAMEWVLDLHPLRMVSEGLVNLSIHRVDSGNVLVDHAAAKAPAHDAESVRAATEAVKQREEHERRGAQQLRSNSEFIQTEAEFYAFLLLGGHLGYRNFTIRNKGSGSVVPGNPKASKGVGW